ncbi:hypothetical protein QBC38DRAFT_516447 [Podospora fimiseda]|uniref:Uncharacterized protein n=1 Tax=Podospora fimiseda TaxID=252190 RepID=A0AAN7BI35_9PEZI|nr:hypothetical protein QBC38DRAFT_516447 [Podospora fimiseda]
MVRDSTIVTIVVVCLAILVAVVAIAYAVAVNHRRSCSGAPMVTMGELEAARFREHLRRHDRDHYYHTNTPLANLSRSSLVAHDGTSPTSSPAHRQRGNRASPTRPAPAAIRGSRRARNSRCRRQNDAGSPSSSSDSSRTRQEDRGHRNVAPRSGSLSKKQQTSPQCPRPIPPRFSSAQSTPPVASHSTLQVIHEVSSSSSISADARKQSARTSADKPPVVCKFKRGVGTSNERVTSDGDGCHEPVTGRAKTAAEPVINPARTAREPSTNPVTTRPLPAINRVQTASNLPTNSVETQRARTAIPPNNTTSAITQRTTTRPEPVTTRRVRRVTWLDHVLGSSDSSNLSSSSFSSSSSDNDTPGCHNLTVIVRTGLEETDLTTGTNEVVIRQTGQRTVVRRF